MVRWDAIVVGAGVVGSASAWEIAQTGRSVLVLDAGEIASGTSCRAMGHIGIYDESEAQLALSCFARRCWDTVAERLAPAVEYVRRGSLWIAADASEQEEAARRGERLRARGIDARLLDRAELYAVEPNLRDGLAGGLQVPGDAVVDATEATRFFAEEARRLGAEFRTGTPVVGLEPEGVRLANGEMLCAGRLVVAAGWQTPRLLSDAPVRPRKGHIALTAALPGWVRHNLSVIGYMAETRPTAGDSISVVVQPRTSGRYLLGATRQFAGASTEVDPAVIRNLLAEVYALVPGLRGVPIERTWAGLRPAGPDSVPIIGPWPGHPSWIVATAHEGIGITTSLATGRLVAELVADEPPSIPLDPFSAARFARA
jgi:D-hydroxyproline dehydrogenase subunit beta